MVAAGKQGHLTQLTQKNLGITPRYEVRFMDLTPQIL